MKLKLYRVTGVCLVPASVETQITALNEDDARRIAESRFNTCRNKMAIDPDVKSAYDFRAGDVHLRF